MSRGRIFADDVGTFTVADFSVPVPVSTVTDSRRPEALFTQYHFDRANYGEYQLP